MRAPGRSRLKFPSFSSIGLSEKNVSPQLFARREPRFTSTTTTFLKMQKTKHGSRTSGNKEGWIVLTKDHRIRYRNIERTALLNAGVGAFILTAGDLSGEEMANVFVKALPAISKFLAKHDRPFIARVTKSGSVTIMLEHNPA